MTSIAQQSLAGNTTFESLGLHFFPRVLKEEAETNGGDDADAGLREKYFIELSATGLGLFEAKTPRKDQREAIGSATVWMVETRFQNAEHNFKGCTIEQLDVKTGNNLTDIAAFAAILRVIQSLTVECHAVHLAMIHIEGSCWSSGLLKNVGFNLCDCLLPQDARVDFQLCMALPATRIERPRVENPATHKNDGVEAVVEEKQSVAIIPDIRGPARKKDYCMSWIRRGECDFVQKGCKRMHDIPLDEEGRLRIGLREIPHWFKESEYWRPFLAQVDPSERAKLEGYGHYKATHTAQPFGQHSGLWDNHVTSHGGDIVATTTHDPPQIGPYNVQLPHEHRHQNTNSSNMGAETSLAGPSSANSTKPVNTTAGRRAKTNNRKASAIEPHSGRGEMQGPTQENSKVTETGEQEQPKVRGKHGRNRKKTRAHKHALGPIEEEDCGE